MLINLSSQLNISEIRSCLSCLQSRVHHISRVLLPEIQMRRLNPRYSNPLLLFCGKAFLQSPRMLTVDSHCLGSALGHASVIPSDQQPGDWRGARVCTLPERTPVSVAGNSILDFPRLMAFHCLHGVLYP